MCRTTLRNLRTADSLQSSPRTRPTAADAISRQHYLEFVYPNGVPRPWTWDLEARLPEDLQDWSRFRGENDPD